MDLMAAVAFIREFKVQNPPADKEQVEAAFVAWCDPQRQRKVHVCTGYSIRFAEANKGTFSNVVLSLSSLRNLDPLPFVVCVVRPDRLDFHLANTTFLKKISHSSHMLRVDNVKGSFLGSNIMRSYEGIENRPENFSELFAIHSSFTWQENLERLVETTNSIVGQQTRYNPTEAGRIAILDAPARALVIRRSRSFQEIADSLTRRVIEVQEDILREAGSENINLRGNSIERLITGANGAHDLGDFEFNLDGGTRLVVDVKTKLLDRASAPKAYNVDKMLALLATPGTAFAFHFVGVDVDGHRVQERLTTMFDPIVLEATRVQFHWAGRTSRGVTQLVGNISRVFDAHHQADVDIDRGRALLEKLLAL